MTHHVSSTTTRRGSIRQRTATHLTASLLAALLAMSLAGTLLRCDLAHLFAPPLTASTTITVQVRLR